MKKILFRKLIVDYLKFTMVALMLASIVIWVFQAVNYLDIMIEDGRDYLVYLKFTILSFPKIISKILPFVIFFSIFYVTTKYEQNNELIIYWNFGVSKIQIVNYILKFSILIMLFQIFLTSYIVPATQDTARSFLRSSTINFYGNFVKPKKFNDTIKGVTIYSERKDKNGVLYNLYLKKELGNNEFQITIAKSGEFKEILKTPVLVLYEGSTISAKNDEYSNITFSKSDFILSNFETNTTTYKKTQELSSKNLIKCIINFYQKEIFVSEIENCELINLANILKEFYKRFIIPLYIPILTLIPFILLIISKENSKYQRFKFVTFLIGFFVILFSETSIKIISDLLIKNLPFVIFPFLILAIIYIYLFFMFKKNLNN